ncbi:Splicing coactivator SRm160/300, subunit SRm300 [Trichoderma guizhouense]|uniref:Splicing coactivator SRm160/300, subunit SRm300 n=1 Tax=Trichoderma guizhouense TaxID=1491466 RepID=A0A1T3CK20_9HYPO|nr:Splicing coactivator SRm160/300, subunit SRm300 [Trichoderma guizhouense]
MVSFFGLRFGSDKKKSQSKQSDKKQVAQQPQQTPRWNGNGDDSFKFPKPQPPSSRPGTSTSNARNLGWRATFKGVPAASSMVDLSVPRKPSESSLRHGIDGAGFKPWMKPNASMTNLAVPDPFGVNAGGRPGMPSRPAGSRQSEWVNPLDVHFNKKSGSTSKSSNRASSGGIQAVASKSPLNKPDSKAEPEPEPEPAKRASGGLDGLDDFGEPGPDVGIRGSGYAGYPSPPQSVETEDQWPPMAFAGGDTGAETDIEAEVEAEAEGEVEVSTSELHQDQFVAPGFANGPGPTMLPSPSSSTSRKSEDKRASPVVRNVQAKRDTLTFLSPRRRSFTMAIEADDLEKHRQQQHPVEGLTGNFSNFDFGDGVTKQPAVAVGTLGLELVESPIQMKGPHPFRDVVRADEGDVEETMDAQDAVTAEDAEDAASDGLTEPSETASLVSPIASPIGSPMASPMASPRASPKQHQVYHQAQESIEQNSPQRLKVAIPDEDSQSISSNQPLPSPSAVSAGIESPRQIIRRPSQANIEAPVALASVLNSFPPSTPQGFNTRMTSDSRSRSRGPPQPLQHATLSSLVARMETPTQSPRSPYGPAAADEDTYVRTYEAPRPPMDRVPLSPFAARTPMEGEFPVMKGLPRGRQPPRPQIPPSDSPERQSEERSPRPFSKWGGFGRDRSESRSATVPMPRTPKSQRPSSPTWSLSTPTSDVAPRIPSPTFPSLEKAISASSEDFAKSFEISYDAPPRSPLANEFTVNDVPSPSIKPSPVIRVEAKKAPPRPTPSPINLPPSLIRDKGPLTPNSLYSPSGLTFI